MKIFVLGICLSFLCMGVSIGSGCYVYSSLYQYRSGNHLKYTLHATFYDDGTELDRGITTWTQIEGPDVGSTVTGEIIEVDINCDYGCTVQYSVTMCDVSGDCCRERSTSPQEFFPALSCIQSLLSPPGKHATVKIDCTATNDYENLEFDIDPYTGYEDMTETSSGQGWAIFEGERYGWIKFKAQIKGDFIYWIYWEYNYNYCPDLSISWTRTTDMLTLDAGESSDSDLVDFANIEWTQTMGPSIDESQTGEVIDTPVDDNYTGYVAYRIYICDLEDPPSCCNYNWWIRFY
jgi:hypothetical protein